MLAAASSAIQDIQPFSGWYYCEKHALRMSAAALGEV